MQLYSVIAKRFFLSITLNRNLRISTKSGWIGRPLLAVFRLSRSTESGHKRSSGSSTATVNLPPLSP
jgi:hypothetical protein